jgi:hypothetical protein
LDLGSQQEKSRPQSGQKGGRQVQLGHARERGNKWALSGPFGDQRGDHRTQGNEDGRSERRGMVRKMEMGKYIGKMIRKGKIQEKKLKGIWTE